MSVPGFEASGFFEYRHSDGTMRTRQGERVVLVTEKAFGALVAAAARDGDLTPLRRLGEWLGGQVAAGVNEQGQHVADVRDLTPEGLVQRASGVLSLFGWGRFKLQCWGDALVIVTESGPTVDEEQLAAAALLGGVFSPIAGQPVACVPVGEGKFLIADLEIAEIVWQWHQEGASLGSIVARLHVPSTTNEGSWDQA